MFNNVKWYLFYFKLLILNIEVKDFLQLINSKQIKTINYFLCVKNELAKLRRKR